jgi:hypothetical protein
MPSKWGGILIFHLTSNTIAFPLKNIHSISPKGNQFCNVYIKKTTMFFQSTRNNLGQIICPLFSVTCFKEMGIGM